MLQMEPSENIRANFCGRITCDKQAQAATSKIERFLPRQASDKHKKEMAVRTMIGRKVNDTMKQKPACSHCNQRDAFPHIFILGLSWQNSESYYPDVKKRGSDAHRESQHHKVPAPPASQHHMHHT